MKITFKQFERAVREARQYISNYDKSRWKICDIAMSVCEYSKGGRKASGIFTLTKFAEAIELTPHTLSEWCRVKRYVYDKLPKTELKDLSKYSYADFQIVVNQVDLKSSPKEVLNKWRDQINVPIEDKKFIKYYKLLNSVLYNAQRPLHMALIDKFHIEKIRDICELIARLLTKELELREKMSMTERLTKRSNKIKSAIKESSL